MRLVHLLAGDPEEPIACSIIHHDLDHLPQYRAVSYSWIGNSSHDSISCGRHRLSVQRNACQLLKRLRKRDESTALWIDAICINQADSMEQSSQVEMMDRIYSSAETVIMWVGEEDETTPRLATFIELIERLVDGIESPHARYTNGRGLPWRLAPEWTHLNSFLDRPWFTRTWVLQEVSLAQNCILRCGSYSWPWTSLKRVFSFLRGVENSDALGVDRRLNQGVIGYGSRWQIRGEGKYELMKLLVASRGTLVTRPVDKVYAILPMARDRLGINVNYNLSVQELYTDVAARLIDMGSFGILHCASDSVWNNIQGLPSWVPDWTCVDKPKILDPAYILEKLPTKPVTKPDGRLLRLQVREVDCVQAAGVPWPGNQSATDPVIPHLEISEVGSLALSRIEDWHSMLWQPGKNSRSLIWETTTGAFMQTIAANTVSLPSCCPTWEELYPMFKARLRSLMRTGPWRFHSDGLINPRHGLDHYHEAVKLLCYKRTFFLTKEGRMGLGPFFTLPFDRIFCISGVSTPFVMRPTLRGRYKLVGECYVHGIGDGFDFSDSQQDLKFITVE